MHRIELRKGFNGPSRRRAGLALAKGDSIEAELTKEQLEALKADKEFVVTTVKKAKEEAKTVSEEVTEVVETEEVEVTEESKQEEVKEDQVKQMVDEPEAKNLNKKKSKKA